MNITANEARQKCTKSQSIEFHVKKISTFFAGQIRDAIRKGCVRCHRIPVESIFNIANMPSETAKTVIHYRLIKECKDKGFDVYKEEQDGGGATYFTISWYKKNEWKDIKYMSDYTNKHDIKQIRSGCKEKKEIKRN